MPLYYFIYLTVLLGIITFTLRYFFLRRTSVSRDLLMKGIKAENDGNFEEATHIYNRALAQVNKNRFHRKLESQIIEKLKVLQNVAIYKRDQAFIRVNNSWLS